MESKLGNFMSGSAAAAHLKSRAIKNKCYTEAVCITANLIDGLLRIGLVLNYQIKGLNKEIIDELLYQGDEDKIITERDIYKRSLSNKIITKDIFDELEEMYKYRNRIVHRYILSEIKTDDILVTAFEYDLLLKKINEIIYALESKQFKLGVGMSSASNSYEVDLKNIVDLIMEKHNGLFEVSDILENQKEKESITNF